MKILLINPPPRSPDRPNVLVPPLGLAYLAATLEKKGLPVKILDANALRLTWKQFRLAVKQEKAEVIGITGMSPIIDTTFKAVKICRPYTKYLILGGPHVSFFGRRVFQDVPEVDFLVIGEGEMAFLRLIKDLTAGKKPNKIIFAKPVANLDSIPFPARHLLPQHLYQYNLVRDYPFTTIITSRGCPFGCVFCDKSVFGRTYRTRSAENVLSEIEQLVQKYHVKTLIFFDDLFTLDKKRVIKICQGIIKHRFRIDWKAEARVDTVDEEMLHWMKRAGCSVLGYGAESANQKALDLLGKKTTVAQTKKVLQMTRRAGIRTLGYFILGIPGETYQEEQKTIALSLKYCDFAAYSVLTPYPGSELYQLACKKGWLIETGANNPFDQDLKRTSLFSSEWTAQDLKKIVKEAHRRFYFRPSYILQQALGLRNPAQVVTVFKHAFRLFYWALKH